ncbi:peptidyl-prolyl cis-trans isomerase [Fulvitalea axinellae]|uniref:Peptidyl-prolyl cis-trans isomerase n=1 Tax=Fulvitalea axinellae TaxID=1182444 RepID=A0AAU9CSM7_9BACT|nr:peptidyl-prolyl cis-trans isomerase [Fulvitalea axinellae]
MRKLLVLPFLAFLVSCQTFKNTSSVSPDGQTLLVVDGQPVSVEEFVYAFQKNRNLRKDSLLGREAVDDYVKLYVNFKLKVAEAKRLDYDENPEFTKEYADYRKQLAEPYLSGAKVTDELVRRTYDRLKQEVNASHILIRVAENASPEDSLKAYEKIKGILVRAESGADFGKLASEYSEDPSAKQNGGDLGYFSAMRMVQPFEDAAYATAVGKVAGPFRTRFGYHILKVHDKIPARGEIRVAHIMLRLDRNASEADVASAEQKAMEISDAARKGESSWKELCSLFSEDINSKAKGGELPPFGPGRMYPAFENAAFGLSAENSISEPVRTPFGWHVIRFLEKKELPAFEKLEDMIRSRVRHSMKSGELAEALVERLKRENGFVEKLDDGGNTPELSLGQSSAWEKLRSEADTSRVLFTVGNQDFRVADYIDYLEDRQPKAGPATFGKRDYDEYVKTSLVAYEEEHLGDKNPEFRWLSQEYFEGLLLFRIMEDSVWSKASADTSELRKYYDNQPKSYRSPKKVEAMIVGVKSGELKERLDNIWNDKTLLNKTPKKSLEEFVNAESDVNLSPVSGTYRLTDPVFCGKVTFREGAHRFENEGKHYYVWVDKLLPDERKPLEKVRGEVIADYQDELERKWVESLRAKRQVTVNRKVLRQIYKRFE